MRNRCEQWRRRGGKHRNYCFTHHKAGNEEDADVSHIEAWLAGNCCWACFGHEKGQDEENPTYHLQGAMRFTNPRTWSALQKKIGDWASDLTIMDDEPKNHRDKYCMKEGGEFWEIGNCPMQGARGDIAQGNAAAREGISTMEAANRGLSVAGFRTFKEMKAFYPPERIAPKVHWFYGDTGTGKTNCAKQFAAEAAAAQLDEGETIRYYWGMVYSRDHFLLGWQDHMKVAIFDEFRGRNVPLEKVLTWTNRPAINVRGGDRAIAVDVRYVMEWFNPTDIFFTSPKHPLEEYKDEEGENLFQLSSRIHDCREFWKDAEGDYQWTERDPEALPEPENYIFG